MRKLPVPYSVMVTRSYYSHRCLPQNSAAWRVVDVKLTFNKGWLPDKQFAPNLYPLSGREYLQVLTGWRTGLLDTL
jgi:hypothetical protein